MYIMCTTTGIFDFLIGVILWCGCLSKFAFDECKFQLSNAFGCECKC